MLLSMLLSWAAVVPSETLVLAGGEAGEGVLLPVLRRAVVSPMLVGGRGLLGLSIFTVSSQSELALIYRTLPTISVRKRITLGFVYKFLQHVLLLPLGLAPTVPL